ncbi:hypothetical protein HNO88_002260 [Novosphingobium chloroacetimidivorans]|uniref:Uncharacterized protein n=1 Tax=Novosphingobium chloroacetimidivorans TaxID=1428314 RepID=A0A7W7NX04_9SPHN|nr:hypothetical protein [Novosphingobium chloroacetimidivorans]MBB4858934.1 hypothetical protein [Novosphingobium chloroacetimidivorans]
MNLQQLCAGLPPKRADVPFPTHLLGVFRRKSITFATGVTDERTVVYWFQSAGFTIDLRLPHGDRTRVAERQGWIGDTVWDDAAGLLSWNIASSYQPRNQWPEPARLHAIGNAVLEFAPSGAYVEDWRQQATIGPLLGLRLIDMVDEATGERISLDGGLVLAGDHVAFARARQPGIQARLLDVEDLDAAVSAGLTTSAEVESYEVSVALGGELVTFSTQDQRIGQAIVGPEFEITPDGDVTLPRIIDGRAWLLRFAVDCYDPACAFGNQSPLTPEARVWMDRESEHLLVNAETCR